MLTVFLLSLAGLPPLAGFYRKILCVRGRHSGKFITLTIVAAVNSVIAAYYYFRIIRLMYLTPATAPRSPLPPKP
jgi:NADH-quinone oxidoreductase subunit N